MKMRSKIQKWGNSLAIRITGVMRDIPHFEENMPIEIVITESGLTIKKAPIPKRRSLPFSETELLKDLTPESAHADILAKPIEGEY